MYEIKQSLMTNGKIIEAGSIVDDKAIPKTSIQWLLDQAIIVKVDKKYKEKKLQEIAEAKKQAEAEEE